jgi:hypothetical protein
VMFRSEFFNVTNTPHFGLSPQLLPSPRVGQITVARDPRILQFALKFNW